MPCFDDECYKKICSDTKTVICLVVVILAIIALLAFAIYLVAKPVVCYETKPVVYTWENRMYKHPDRKPPKCKETSILNYPQLVAIIEKSTNVHICSGAILPKDWILTAAHCLMLCQTSRCSNYYVRTGSTYSNRGGDIYMIERFHMHPEFNSTSLKNNIGLIKIRDFKVNNRSVSYATIYSIPIKTIKWAELLGWSPYSKADIIYRDNVLKRINLTIEAQLICIHRMKGEYTKFTLDKNMLCGTYPTIGGGCYTDAGGPLMRGNEIIGVAMFGQFCYSCDYHMSILTNISYFRSFVKKFTVV